MIIGLAYISILLLPYVQVMFLKLFLLFMRHDKNLEKVVRKNFESHESRNTKTAMMFTVALSFLIFAGSTFDLIGNMVVTQLESVLGADVYITTRFSPNYIDEGPIVQFLEEQKAIDQAITGYSFSTVELTEILKACRVNGQALQRLMFSSASGYNEA